MAPRPNALAAASSSARAGALGLMLALHACASPVGIDTQLLDAETLISDAPRACTMAFAPNPALAAETAAAAARWSAATGCDIRIADEGIPIIAVPQLYIEVDGAMRAACGAISWVSPTEASEIQVSVASDIPDCTLAGYSVLHEMGHAVAHSPQHSESGIMAQYVADDGRAVIDDASLALVCGELACSAYVPEHDLSDVAHLQ